MCAVACCARSRTIWRIRRSTIGQGREDLLLAWRICAEIGAWKSGDLRELDQDLCPVLRQKRVVEKAIGQSIPRPALCLYPPDGAHCG